MPELTGSDDVYKSLVEQSDENWLFGLVAFAVVEEQRLEWMRHFAEQNNRAPDDDEIRHWYRQQPDTVLVRAKGEAENALQVYAEDVLQEILEAERREVSNGVVVAEVRRASRFWPQFGASVAAGLMSTLLFALMLAALALILVVDSSPEDIVRYLFDSRGGVSSNGETGGTSGAGE